jgi:hypothetical protein
MSRGATDARRSRLEVSGARVGGHAPSAEARSEFWSPRHRCHGIASRQPSAARPMLFVSYTRCESSCCPFRLYLYAQCTRRWSRERCLAKVEEADAAAAAAETAAAEIVPNTWHSIPSVVLVRPSRPAGLAASSRKPGDAAAAPAASSSSKRMPVVSRQDKIFCLLPCLYSA